MGFMGWLIFIIVFVILFILAGYVMRKQKRKEINALDHFDIGHYISGLGSVGSGLTECMVTERDLLFFTQQAVEFGRIPRDLINAIYVEDHSQIQSRITATRMLTLGIFSLAAKKKTATEEYFILIDWQNEKGAQENALFKYSGMASRNLANIATEKLRKHIITKRAIVKEDEKKCPFCAEIIKSEAKICKHCKSALIC